MKRRPTLLASYRRAPLTWCVGRRAALGPWLLEREMLLAQYMIAAIATALNSHERTHALSRGKKKRLPFLNPTE